MGVFDWIKQNVGRAGDWLQQAGKKATDFLQQVPIVGDIVSTAKPLLDTVSQGWDAVRGRAAAPNMDQIGKAVQSGIDTVGAVKGAAGKVAGYLGKRKAM